MPELGHIEGKIALDWLYESRRPFFYEAMRVRDNRLDGGDCP